MGYYKIYWSLLASTANSEDDTKCPRYFSSDLQKWNFLLIRRPAHLNFSNTRLRIVRWFSNVSLTRINSKNNGLPSLPGALHLHHNSFSKPSTALPMSQVILQLFRCFTYIIGTSPMSQLILQPFCYFTNITAHSTTLLLLHLHQRHFMYFTWRAAHA